MRNVRWKEWAVLAAVIGLASLPVLGPWFAGAFLVLVVLAVVHGTRPWRWLFDPS